MRWLFRGALLVGLLMAAGCPRETENTGGSGGAGGGGGAAGTGGQSGGQGCALCDGDCETGDFEFATAPHVTDPIDYADRPPTGGEHDPCWTTWGVHPEPVPDDNWVHNLEHGGVVFLYNCPGGCPDEVADLTAYVETLGPTAVLTPYSDMSWAFAVVAWEHRLLTGCLDLAAAQAFYDAHVNQAPESVTADPPPTCP